LAPDWRASLRLAATACFCGWPAFTISLMFSLTTFRDFPFFSGMSVHLRLERQSLDDGI
jgi:hypothetical protein